MSWSIVGASVKGTSHHQQNAPCQDAWGSCGWGPDNAWLAIAVADGAGSAALAEVGAALTCEELLQQLALISPEFLSCDHLRTIYSAVRQRLIAEAESRQVRPRDLACTALLAVIGPDRGLLAQIGDGAIVIGNGTQYIMPHWPEPGEYANLTDFLTDEHYAQALTIHDVPGPIHEVAVLSDGLQRLALDFAQRAPHAPFFRPLFQHLRSVANPLELQEPLRSFLNSDMINTKTDDDKTLVLAVRRS